MNNKISKHLNELRDCIGNNLEIIEKLIMQSKELGYLACSLGSDTLQEKVQEINSSIKDMIDNTSNIFNEYEEITKTLLKK